MVGRKKLGIVTAAAEQPRREPEAVKSEIADLERMLKKRTGKPGFADNVKAIEARLAACRTELGNV